MLSALIRSRHSYPAMLLAEQPVHQRSVHSGPLVLGASLLKILRLQQIGDQPVSRMLNHLLLSAWTIPLSLFKKRDNRRLSYHYDNSSPYRTKSLRGQALALLAKFKIKN